MNSDQEKVYGKQDFLVRDPEGFSKLIRHLSNQTFASNDPRLRLNERVVEVHFELENDESVPNDLPDDGVGVYVKTAAGNEYYARFCIITFPVRQIPSSLTSKIWVPLLCLHVERGDSERQREVPSAASSMESPCVKPVRNSCVRQDIR